MRIQLLSFITIFSLLVSFPAIAADWVHVASSTSNTKYVDKQSIKGDATDMEFWEKTVFKKEQKDFPSSKYYISTVEYLEIDCNNKTYKLHEITYYAIDEEVISHTTFPTPNIARIVPDSVADTVEKYVCSFTPTQ